MEKRNLASRPTYTTFGGNKTMLKLLACRNAVLLLQEHWGLWKEGRRWLAQQAAGISPSFTSHAKEQLLPQMLCCRLHIYSPDPHLLLPTRHLFFGSGSASLTPHGACSIPHSLFTSTLLLLHNLQFPRPNPQTKARLSASSSPWNTPPTRPGAAKPSTTVPYSSAQVISWA